eukprot:13337480-Alexandrium_andersonii.AAC.1
MPLRHLRVRSIHIFAPRNRGGSPGGDGHPAVALSPLGNELPGDRPTTAAIAMTSWPTPISSSSLIIPATRASAALE